MSKYHARKTVVDGIEFDSRREADRYAELKLLQRAGKITDLMRQVTYVLIPRQKKPSGGYERPVTYTADFVYIDRDGHTVVEDVKGVKTQQYIIRRKLMLREYGIEIREV